MQYYIYLCWIWAKNECPLWLRCAMLSSACRCWCLAWCSWRFTVSRLSRKTCISKCAAGWQPVGHDDIGKSHLRWCLPCTTFKLSVYESAAAVKHPVQTQSQVLLYLESMQERCRGRGRFTRGQARPWSRPLTLWFILNEVEGSTAQQCTRPVYIVQSPLRLAEIMRPLRVEWSVCTWWVFNGYPSGWGSSFFSILGNLKNFKGRLNFPVHVFGGSFFPVTARKNLQGHEVTLVLSC